MIVRRPAEARGHANYGWLDTHHTFSFNEYFDPDFMGFRTLRVINEDRVEPGQGFGTHPHRDMEIVTYVLEGALEHRDSMGNGSVMRPGDVQRMSAGTGVTHSEFNHSRDEIVHLLQIWILPERRGLTPEYEQKTFAVDERRGRLRLIAAPDGRDGAVTIHQDVDLYASILDGGARVTHAIKERRYGWLQLARGAIVVNGEQLGAGDGAAIVVPTTLDISARESAELLLFDLN